MSVSFDSEEWFAVMEGFECVKAEKNSCVLDDVDEELVSDCARARVPKRRLEGDPPSESLRKSALRLAGRVAFNERAG
jgi:hypothetical protein